MARKFWRELFAEHYLVLAGGILRFVSIFPLSGYSTGAQLHWNTIKDHALLQQNGPYDPAIASSEKLAQTWGTFGFWWVAVGWIPSVLLPAPPSILFGILDGCIAAFISAATYAQASHVPHKVSGCRGSGAFEFNRPSGANESFFEAAARLNATVTDPFTMCKSYSLQWQYGVSISVLFSIIATLKIAGWFTEMRGICREAHDKRLPLPEALLTASVQACKFIPYLFGYTLFYLPCVLLFRLLPISVKSRVRFARRCGVKTGQGIAQKSAMQMDVVKKIVRSSEEKAQIIISDGEPATLAEFLGIYDMLILVCQDLHYVDIASLGLVSKSVRTAVLPTESRIHRTMHFKMYTCQRGIRKQCWVCRNQICTDCEKSRDIKQTQSLFHVDHCRPYCSSCYFINVQRVRGSVFTGGTNYADPRHCKCEPATDNPNFWQRCWNGTSYRPHEEPITRTVCQNCNDRSNEELLNKRESMAELELMEGAMDNGLQCHHCSKELGKGARWWVCKKCNKECVSSYHGAWGKWIRWRGRRSFADTHDVA